MKTTIIVAALLFPSVTGAYFYGRRHQLADEERQAAYQEGYAAYQEEYEAAYCKLYGEFPTTLKRMARASASLEEIVRGR